MRAFKKPYRKCLKIYIDTLYTKSKIDMKLKIISLDDLDRFAEQIKKMY